MACTKCRELFNMIENSNNFLIKMVGALLDFSSKKTRSYSQIYAFTIICIFIFLRLS
jgi:hypothetical protein